MKISQHADRTEKLVGVRAEDIHQWIDNFFDTEGFDKLLSSGRSPDYDPYDHRKFRHCQEAIEQACTEFKDKYTADQVRAVFECHIRDDYDGYLPHREDFENEAFKGKYHESEGRADNDHILNSAELAEYFQGKVYSRGPETATRSEQNTFRLRIVLPTSTAIALFIAAVFIFVIPFFRESMLDRKKEMIRELTNAAASVISSYAKQAQSGVLTQPAAKKLAAEQIKGMRYGPEGKDYFWITDMHPRMVMHPYRPELVGADLRGYSDTGKQGGKKVFVEFVGIVRAQGAGYSEYIWQWQDDRGRKAPKLSYVTSVPAWGWVIGTGVYLDDVQTQIDLLTRNLTLIFLIFGLLLTGILISLVWQSRRIEDNRVRAEAGLHEAKERYRALVEASKEGYILHIDGECIYSNRTLQHLVALTPDALANMKVWDLLAPDVAGNEDAREILMKLDTGEVKAQSFAAQLATRGGGSVDVMVTISKIFFSDKNGHVLSFRPIKRTRVRSLLETFVDASLAHEDRSGVLEELRSSQSVGQVVSVLNRLSLLVREMADQGVRPGPLRHTIGQAFDATVRSLLEMAIKELGEPPVAFALLSLGSNARHEMTMFSDQDNALVFADVPGEQLDVVTRYFLKLANHLCSDLDTAGFKYCEGGIMAFNPKWCLPLAQWKNLFTGWVTEATPESLLDINVFLDIHRVYGDKDLVSELVAHVHELTRDNHAFFMQLARNCLDYRPPVELLSPRRSSKHGGTSPRTINIKEALKPVEIFVRIHALKHRIAEPGTMGRLRDLEQSEALEKTVVSETIYIFDYLWRMRFYNQLFSDADLRQVNDTLDVTLLTEVERQTLLAVLSRLRTLQEKLCAEFIGMPLHLLPK